MTPRYIKSTSMTNKHDNSLNCSDDVFYNKRKSLYSKRILIAMRLWKPQQRTTISSIRPHGKGKYRSSLPSSRSFSWWHLLKTVMWHYFHCVFLLSTLFHWQGPLWVSKCLNAFSVCSSICIFYSKTSSFLINHKLLYW